MKTCYRCGITKSLDCFGSNKSKKDGKTAECRECKRKMDNLYSSKNREKAKQRASQWYYDNLEYAKEVRKVISAKWAKENKDKNCAKAAKYRASKLKATPPWLTNEDIKEIETEYALAAWTSEVMGSSYHVDHIVPLQGKKVCGLHVPWNLRVIPAVENIKKGNRDVLLLS